MSGATHVADHAVSDHVGAGIDNARFTSCGEHGCNCVVDMQAHLSHIARCIQVAACGGMKSEAFWVGFLDLERTCSNYYTESTNHSESFDYFKGMNARANIGMRDYKATGQLPSDYKHNSEDSPPQNNSVLAE
jgi:hypothetical protein